MKHFMVIEHFAPGAKDRIYQRFQQHGRMLPDGLYYCDSWLAQDGARCFQLMQTSAPALFEQWFGHWNDLIRFELVELGEKPQRKT